LSLVNSFQAHSDEIIKIKQSPFNTNYVATCSEDRKVKIWNVASSSNWTLITTYSQHSDDVRALEWLDSDTLASADQKIKLWSPTTSQTKRTIQTNQSVLVWETGTCQDLRNWIQCRTLGNAHAAVIIRHNIHNI
jgi:WD40 repeat protein